MSQGNRYIIVSSGSPIASERGSRMCEHITGMLQNKFPTSQCFTFEHVINCFATSNDDKERIDCLFHEFKDGFGISFYWLFLDTEILDESFLIRIGCIIGYLALRIPEYQKRISFWCPESGKSKNSQRHLHNLFSEYEHDISSLDYYIIDAERRAQRRNNINHILSYSVTNDPVTRTVYDIEYNESGLFRKEKSDPTSGDSSQSVFSLLQNLLLRDDVLSNDERNGILKLLDTISEY